MAEQDTLRSGENGLYSRVRNDHEESAVYDDPTPWLNDYDSRHTKPGTPLSRPMEIADIDEALADSRTLTPDQDSTFRRYETYRDEEDEAADIVWSDEWDSTESEESDDEPTLGSVISQLSTGASDTIPILGSLMLDRQSSVIEQQGIFQGLVVDEQERERMGILPVAVYMTQTLEKFGSQLEDLSVRVTRETEIVPTSPFDFNAPGNSGTGRSVSSSGLPTVKRQNVVNTRDKQKQETSSSGVKYTSNIVRPPILPPLDESETTAEKKKYQVMYHLLQSEAGFLTSLKIAVEVYMMPLKELAAGSNPILDTSQVVKLFGPVELLLQIHELFYTALCMRAKDWSSKSLIGDVFLSSFNRREVKKHYTDYVNNFTDAMSIIERGINKKQRLVDFLQQQLEKSPSQLSLQALLLKPIQRFPQYILFLKDFIKYTSAQHGDCVILQMAQANIEGTAEFLNEAKRQAEQVAIVRYLSSRFDKLPFRLNETQQVLLRQDVVTILKKVVNKVPQYSQRQLLLFSDMIICAAKKENRLSWIGGSDVNAGDIRLEYKWHCQLSQITVTDPDYENQTVPYIHPSVNETSSTKSLFRNLKEDIRQLDDDFHSLTKIVVHVFSLHKQYSGLSQSNIQTDIRMLQRELENKKNQLVSCEPGRLDLIKTSKNDNSGTLAQYTMLFDSEKRKLEWLRLLHFAKLKQGQTNTLTWIYEQEEEEELIDDDTPNFSQGSKTLSTVYNLPLFVDCFKLAPNSFNVECSTCVGSKTVWFATGSSDSAQITVFRCLSPSPILVETFPIDTKKITCMLATPSNTPGHAETHDAPLFVWIGSSFGRLLLYSADTKKCVASTQLPYAITCIQKYKNRVFVGTTGGTLVVFTQLRDNDWDLENKRTVPASDCAIECLCAVDKKLWIGSGQRCIIMGMGSLRLQASVRVTTREGATVNLLTSTGIGVWVSLSKGAILYLYHCDTRKSLQEIDTRGSLENISEYARLQSKLAPLNSLTVTSLLASRGNLWVGTSVGAILVYRIPHLNGLPIINGKPILASDGHRGPVRVILRIRTKLDISTARFDQFVSDEERRNVHAERLPAQQNSKGVQHLEPRPLAQGRSSPAPVDISKPPPVSQIIKQLEKKKGSVVHVRPTGPQLRYVDSENEEDRQEEPEVTDDGEVNDGGYEDASLILNEYTQAELVEDERVYDQVPTEDLSDTMEQEEEEDSMEIRRSRGDTVIDPTRYEMDSNSLDSRCASVFTLINEDPLESSAHVRQTSDQVEGSFFVFTGGSGLANFRNQSQKQESLPSRDAMGNLPCVLAYQIPNL